MSSGCVRRLFNNLYVYAHAQVRVCLCIFITSLAPSNGNKDESDINDDVKAKRFKNMNNTYLSIYLKRGKVIVIKCDLQ